MNLPDFHSNRWLRSSCNSQMTSYNTYEIKVSEEIRRQSRNLLPTYQVLVLY